MWQSAFAANRARWLRAAALAVCAAGAGAAPAQEGGLRPEVQIEHPGHCVAPAEQMRREHPDMLRHQRDRTVRAGVRGAPVRLQQCIDCHANRSNGSVIGSDKNFCEGCHRFVGVRPDCFECHQPARLRDAGAGSAGSAGTDYGRDPGRNPGRNPGLPAVARLP